MSIKDTEATLPRTPLVKTSPQRNLVFIVGMAIIIVVVAVLGGIYMFRPSGGISGIDPTAVLGYKGDNSRNGAFTHETTLNTNNVNPFQFGKLASLPIDGKAYAQPLFMPNVQTPSGKMNLVFVATEHDSVYAFNADTLSPTPVWHTSFLINGATTPTPDEVRSGDTVPEIGITGTPAIDPTSGTLFVSAMTKENGTFIHRIHALNIANGQEQPNSPVIVAASVPGYGGDGDGNGLVNFNAIDANQRPGLLYLNGVVYVGYASFSDMPPYHGWVLAYDAKTLKLLHAFVTSPNSKEGAGIWMSGAAFSVDPTDNSIFFTTGNGDSFNLSSGGDESSQTTYRLSTPNLKPIDYFAPYNADCLNQINSEVGSSGVIVLPPQPGPHPNLVVTSGKEGRIYVMDRNNLGGFTYTPDACSNPGATNIDKVVQEFLPSTVPGGIYGTPAFWQGPKNGNLYIQGTDGTLHAFTMTNGQLSAQPTSESPEIFSFPGGNPSISSNGSTASSGIVWLIAPAAVCATTTNPNCVPSDSISLRAYDASNLARELYTSADVPKRDTPGGSYVKFTVPMVAQGKVFMGTTKTLEVYGELPAAQATPTPQGGIHFTPPPQTPDQMTNPGPNNIGITSDTTAGTKSYQGNFDGSNASYSQQALAAAGFSAGQPVTVNGVRFIWPKQGQGVNDNWQADGQTLTAYTIPKATTIGFLGASVGDQSDGIAKLTYTDNTTVSYELTFNDWQLGGGDQPLVPSTSIAAVLPYYNSAQGKATDLKTYVFFTSFKLDPTKTLAKIQLPPYASSKTIHIFAIGYSAAQTQTHFAPAGSTPAYARNFASMQYLQPNGTGISLANGRLRLTDGNPEETTSVFYTTRVDVSNFTMNFQFQDTAATADGFAFVIQNSGQGLETFSEGGSMLGYGGVGSSVGIKFDLYDNNSDNQTTSTGMYLDGIWPNHPEVALPGLNFHSGHIFNVQMSYSGVTLVVVITDTITKVSATQTYTVDIPANTHDKMAYVGFTAASGGGTAIQDILNWTYTTGNATTPQLPNFQEGFQTKSGLQFNGDPLVLTGYRMRLTDTPKQHDSVYYSAPVPVDAFNTQFAFTNQPGQDGGFAFVLQNTGANAIGQGGSGLGAAGIGKSVILPFTPSGTGEFSNGAQPTHLTAFANGLDLNSGDTFIANLSYDGTTLVVKVTDEKTGASAQQHYTLDIPGTVGSKTAYVGFTSAANSNGGTQEILSWVYGQGAASSADPNYPQGFSTSSGLQFNGGGASYAGTNLQLTDGKNFESTSVYFPQKVGVTGFTTQFTYQATNPQDGGITFVIQNSGTNALGPQGSALGYQGIKPSVAFALTLWDPNKQAPSSLIGVFTNGANPVQLQAAPGGLDFHTGDPFLVNLTYAGKTLTVKITDTVTKGSGQASFPVDIATTLGGNTAYVGFTAATGDHSAIQNIQNWTYIEQ